MLVLLPCTNLGEGESELKINYLSDAAFPFLLSYLSYWIFAVVNVKTHAYLWYFKGRPQPSWDRTCTAAAAAGLLSELQLLPRFSSVGLDKQSEVVEHALTVLLEALTKRRLRMGRSITRKVRPNNIC